MNLSPYEITTTSIDIIVEEIEPIVGPYREKYTFSGAKGCPAHFALLYPFAHPDEVNKTLVTQLRNFFSKIRPFEYSFEGIDFFPKCAFLLPRTTSNFQNITQSLMTQYPQYKPYDEDFTHPPTPHVTIAQHKDDSKLKRIALEFKQNEFRKLPKILTATHAYLTYIENGYSTPKYRFDFMKM